VTAGAPRRSDHHFTHPALTSFADECCATLARLTLYVGALMLFAIAGLHIWDQLQFDMARRARRPARLYPGFPLAPRLCRHLA
jgi:hypothetical protein